MTVFELPLILGSQSPRRKDLLLATGLNLVNCIRADIDESLDEAGPIDNVKRLAFEKNQHLKHRIQNNQILITADTLVSQNDMILGKPVDIDQAKEFIRKYSLSKHEIHTGVCISDVKNEMLFHVTSVVEFEEITEAEIEFYVHNNQVLDKAGAYGIQDWLGIAKITSIFGSYTNIMGLPMEAVYKTLLSW